MCDKRETADALHQWILFCHARGLLSLGIQSIDDYVLCRNETSAKKKDEMSHLLRLFEKIISDQQYRKKVRTTTLYL